MGLRLTKPTRTIALLTVISGMIGSGVLSQAAQAEPLEPIPSAPIRPPIECPAEVSNLTGLMLRDLPSYTNRVLQRSLGQLEGVDRDRPGFVLLASEAEFQPLPVGAGAAGQINTVSPDETVDQLFFTTLEYQYVRNQRSPLQHYHWAFLTQTDQGWRLALLFSRIGDYPAVDPPTPPMDTSTGAIAQAIRQWLEDCRAGAVAGVDPAQPYPPLAPHPPDGLERDRDLPAVGFPREDHR